MLRCRQRRDETRLTRPARAASLGTTKLHVPLGELLSLESIHVQNGNRGFNRGPVSPKIFPDTARRASSARCHRDPEECGRWRPERSIADIAEREERMQMKTGAHGRCGLSKICIHVTLLPLGGRLGRRCKQIQIRIWHTL